MISVSNVGVEYRRGQWAVRDVSFTVQKGEFVLLTGHSGAGKTTLMKLLSFEKTPTVGRVQLEDFASDRIKKRRLPYLRRRIGPVFQDFRLLRERTAYENVALVLEATGAGRNGLHRRVLRALAQVGLSNKADSRPDELSGGEQQRVAIARAIINDPFVLLADEPTGNLDEGSADAVLELLLALVRDTGCALLMVTHSQEVAALADRTLTIRHGRLEAL